MMAAVQNNFAPGTISLEGPAAVSAKREEAAKHALSASKIQHSREIQVIKKNDGIHLICFHYLE